MQKLLIHIGYHKSGTTWLQHELFCKSALGFQAPWGLQSHLAIERFVLANPLTFDPEQTRAVLEEGASEPLDSGLVSVMTHEDLCGYPVYGRYYGKEVADRIGATFPNAKVLIGIREQRASIMSHYRQHLRQGEAQTIQQFIGSAERKPGFSPTCRLDHFQYDLLIEHYRNLLGKENVLVLPLEQLKLDMAHYIRQIYDFVGIEHQEMPNAMPRNVGSGGVTLEVVRRINRFNIGVADWSRPRQSIASRAVGKLSRILDAGVPKGAHQAIERRIKAYIDERCEAQFCQSNRRLAELLDVDLCAMGYMV